MAQIYYGAKQPTDNSCRIAVCNCSYLQPSVHEIRFSREMECFFFTFCNRLAEKSVKIYAITEILDRSSIRNFLKSHKRVDVSEKKKISDVGESGRTLYLILSSEDHLSSFRHF